MGKHLKWNDGDPRAGPALDKQCKNGGQLLAGMVEVVIEPQ